MVDVKFSISVQKSKRPKRRMGQWKQPFGQVLINFVPVQWRIAVGRKLSETNEFGLLNIFMLIKNLIFN